MLYSSIASKDATIMILIPFVKKKEKAIFIAQKNGEASP